MDLEKTPKCDPPPYTSSEPGDSRTTTFSTTTTKRHPTNNIQPQFTIVSNHINEQQQDLPIPPPVPLNNLQTPLSGGRFPTTVNLYFRPRTRHGRDYFLGTAQSNPLNEVTFHSIRLPSITLHPGFDKSCAIATFNHSSLLRSSRVYAPWLAGGHTDIRTTHIPRKWTFTARIGHAESGVIERFEWRRTSSHTVYYHLDARQGWKLVRMNRAARTLEGAERSRALSARGMARRWLLRLLLGIMGCRSTDTGGGTGELGEEWEALAVITALGIWHRNKP
ncbi:hypothetical protein VP1G_01962 [Cytospora mali]|uniref:Uncharacterized protein n=1 Tax=Cytospora mali TaxID=578113 RepID=A0A194USB8_CYTMA|nr:hypothetical protein VP1G_01962 [Valsa mali var. pyri (nom. inval.)]